MSKVIRLNDETMHLLNEVKNRFGKDFVMPPDTSESQWVKMIIYKAYDMLVEADMKDTNRMLAKDARTLCRRYDEDFFTNDEELVEAALKQYICEIKASHGLMKRELTSTGDLYYVEADGERR